MASRRATSARAVVTGAGNRAGSAARSPAERRAAPRGEHRIGLRQPLVQLLQRSGHAERRGRDPVAEVQRLGGQRRRCAAVEQADDRRRQLRHRLPRQGVEDPGGRCSLLGQPVQQQVADLPGQRGQRRQVVRAEDGKGPGRLDAADQLGARLADA
ncbi:hypothetical protein EAO71_04715 [Streptomyces sp. ms191]|nr:hypothetical protein EAO71_04715 [Streptomyces sp. ms191]